MKITLVTLSFNQREFLARTLQSVFQQGYPDLEYIIVDPGSTDGSRELIEEHRNEFAHAVLEPDKGPSDGLNKGFALASGEIYGFINADDLLLPHALERVAEHFMTHPECDVLMGDGFLIDADDRVLRHVRARAFSVQRYLYSGSSWLQQSTFFRSKAYKTAGGFNIANRSSWDGELFLTMAKQDATFQYMHRDLASFRMHGESISTRIQKGGDDPVVAAYEAECHRMFEAEMGRPWGLADEVYKLAFRAERKLFHPSELIQAILHRIRSARG